MSLESHKNTQIVHSNYQHQATSIEEQIELLNQRGLIINDTNKAKEVLSDIGYYRLGFYWYFFQKKKDQFIENTTLDDIIKLYYMDADLKHLLLRFLHRVEINFRTKVIYYVSNFYKNNPTWFVDNQVMTKKYTSNFKKKIYTKDFKHKNIAIKRHHKKYGKKGYAPAWKTLEHMTFGAILKTYESLKDIKLKNTIASLYGIENQNTFINLMNTLVLLRNVCAHGGILCDYQTPIGVKTIKGRIKLSSRNSNNVDACCKVLSCFLKEISINRAHELEYELKNIFEKYKDHKIISKVISQKIGYQPSINS